MACLKARLKAICDKAGVRRDQIGLITGARAELYFNGSWKSVRFDAIDELSTKGTDIIFIEKEGIPDELKEFADKYGIAMVNSRGYLTEFAHDLMIAVFQLLWLHSPDYFVHADVWCLVSYQCR